MSREASSRSRRPFKVWDSSRITRKALVVSSLEELIVRGREKLGLSGHESVKSVLEGDGTQVDDSEYFRSLPDNTVFLLLRPGERWIPAGVDVIRAALSSIPRIVCEAISSLELQNEIPSWKISESRGRITIVLTWDQRPPSTTFPTTTTHTTQPSWLGGRTRTFMSKDGRLETIVNGRPPRITVIPHEESPYDTVPPPLPPHSTKPIPPLISSRPPIRLPNQGSSSLESSASIHLHTPECSSRGHVPQHPPHGSSGGRGSPPDSAYCDFHCCALHESGRKIQVHKAVATSPSDHPTEGYRVFPPPSPIPSTSTSSQRHHHVRFLGLNEDKNGRNNTNNILPIPIPTQSQLLQQDSSNLIRCSTLTQPLNINTIQNPSSTTETSSEEETERDDKRISCKWLLLTDCLGADPKNHLSIKDIGLILERLSTKIIDVESLLRESEGRNGFSWTIKAKIRGDGLREIGLLYNGNYYAISEHPNYSNRRQRGIGGDDSEEDMRL